MTMCTYMAADQFYKDKQQLKKSIIIIIIIDVSSHFREGEHVQLALII